MKKFQLLQVLVLIFITVSCDREKDIKPHLSLAKVSGYVQKGPFLNGTAITITELSTDLVPTGKNYPSQILDNKGTFEVKNVELSSQFVELKADGFYFNEVTNSNSPTQLTLFALSDLTNKTSLNVNVLSTLEKGRIGYLISNGNGFSNAKKQAQSEILTIFEMGKSAMTESELLDISKSGDDNGILLAISVILQGNLTVPDLSELLANISTDIREDGILNSQTLGSALINNAKAIKLDQIRTNLEARYETLGLTVNIPDFEKYVNQFIANTDFKYTSLSELSTNQVTEITANTATCGGNIIKEGVSAVTVRGVCWGTNPNPTTTDNRTTNGAGGGSFISNLSSLIPNTIYYLRAYATNSAGTGYGNEVSFKTSESGVGTITDIDENVYHTVSIGTQIWMVENLKTTKYRNGDPIPNITSDAEWGKQTLGAYCWYENAITNKAIYGALYNWYAVNDARKIAPAGWHVPSNAEWTLLIDYLGGEWVAGDKLKEVGTSHWQSPNAGATNESGFTALPGGYRNYNISFGYIVTNGYWWTSTESGPDNAWWRKIDNYNSNVQNNIYGKKGGYSVRCVKD
jgi:uncharacterized protein (TIGR02145 family)